MFIKSNCTNEGKFSNYVDALFVCKKIHLHCLYLQFICISLSRSISFLSSDVRPPKVIQLKRFIFIRATSFNVAYFCALIANKLIIRSSVSHASRITYHNSMAGRPIRLLMNYYSQIDDYVGASSYILDFIRPTIDY